VLGDKVAKRVMRKYLEQRSASSFKIQITSMVDMFIILLVFLLKSYSTSPVNITPNSSLRLPNSSAQADPVDVIKIIVSNSAIFVEDFKVADVNDGKVDSSQLDKNDREFIRPLYEELDKKAQVTKEISVKNDTVEFDGKVLFQVDRKMPYALLQKVMYTSMLAGYYDVKFAVMSKE
jgi:biopolymer transport protein ExbD